MGRGRSGRRPKTAGRGHKGTGQHGNIAFWYQGGQTPIWRLLPKRGGRNKNTVQYVPLNLDRLKTVIESGKLDASHPINMRHLWKAGAINGSYKFIARDRWGIKLLSRGAEDFDIPIRLEVARASQGAIKAIEAAGGKITCKYYNKLGLRALLLVSWLPARAPRWFLAWLGLAFASHRAEGAGPGRRRCGKLRRAGVFPHL